MALQWWPLLVGGLVLLGGGSTLVWLTRRRPRDDWSQPTVVEPPPGGPYRHAVGSDVTDIQPAPWSTGGDATTILPTPASEAPARLVIQAGPRQGHQYPLTLTETTIGRAADRAIVVNDGAASRQHACIVRDGATYVLYDEPNVGNATRVNGAKVTGPHTLRDGDQVEIGTTRLIFREK